MSLQQLLWSVLLLLLLLLLWSALLSWWLPQMSSSFSAFCGPRSQSRMLDFGDEMLSTEYRLGGHPPFWHKTVPTPAHPSSLSFLPRPCRHGHSPYAFAMLALPGLFGSPCSFQRGTVFVVVLVLVVVLVMKNDGKEPMRPSIKGESERARDQERFMFLRVCVCLCVGVHVLWVVLSVGFVRLLFPRVCSCTRVRSSPPLLCMCVCVWLPCWRGGGFSLCWDGVPFSFSPLVSWGFCPMKPPHTTTRQRERVEKGGIFATRHTNVLRLFRK